MSKNFAVLEKQAVEGSFPPRVPDGNPKPGSGLYGDLIRRLFHAPAAVAIVACHSGESSGAPSQKIAEQLAAELAASGKRVLRVPVDKLLRMNPITPPDEISLVSGGIGNVWVWPAPGLQPVEFFKSRARSESDHWLEFLRRAFDSVLLDCTSVESAQAAAEVAAMADATVLCVEANSTTAQQVKSTQYALQLRGAKLDGTILIQRK